MKKNRILIIIVVAILVTSLFMAYVFFTEKTEKENYISVKVIGKGLDCGEAYIVEVLENKELVAEILNSTSVADRYYADDLPDEYKQVGKQVKVKIRTLEKDEFYPCTTLGPSYSHIRILDVVE